MGNLSVCLLHEGMVDKAGKQVTTSLTLIDLHDISRSSRTYGTLHTYIAHPSPALHNLALTLTSHWQEGYGATYNPDRKQALDNMTTFHHFEEIIQDLTKRAGRTPKLVATSAKEGGERVSFEGLRELIRESDESYLLMLGTGWGMSEELLAKADLFLEPIQGPGDYNHLSVRSACAIMLDRLLAP
ncbi:MAG: RNA methyltransferase [Bdellovibrionales bacterium]|nr:RNA methyltransferase [Bdellovibrionales bacterium]